MKKLLLGMGSAALLAVAGVPANAADQVINLGANVSSFCTIGGSASPVAITPSFPTIANGSVPAGTESLPIGNVVCNSAANVTLTSTKGALISNTGPASGFQNYINYSASVSSPASVTVNADSTSGSASLRTATAVSGGASSGPVSVTFTSVVNSLPLVAGTYTDVLTVSIVPTA